MARVCVYAGSFDPVTVGHEDIIRRAARLCDKLYVTVMYNPSKTGCFSVNQRMEMIRKATAHLPYVRVDKWDGLLVEYMRMTGADCVVRGLRAAPDFESEKTMAQVNAQLLPGLETVFLMTKPEHACISSSVVREAATFGADISAFVPAGIAGDVAEHFRA